MADKVEVTFKINKIAHFVLSEAECEKWLGILNGFVLKNTLSPTFEIGMGVDDHGRLVVELSREEVLSFRQQLLDHKLKRFNRAALSIPTAGDAA